MKVNRIELLGVLQSLKSGLPRKTTSGEISMFIIDKEDIITYNGSICIIYPFDFGFTCGVPDDEFMNLLQKLPDETLDITYKDQSLFIKTKDSKAEIKCYGVEDELDLVSKLNVGGLKYKKVPDGFLPDKPGPPCSLFPLIFPSAPRCGA